MPGDKHSTRGKESEQTCGRESLRHGWALLQSKVGEEEGHEVWLQTAGRQERLYSRSGADMEDHTPSGSGQALKGLAEGGKVVTSAMGWLSVDPEPKLDLGVS